MKYSNYDFHDNPLYDTKRKVHYTVNWYYIIRSSFYAIYLFYERRILQYDMFYILNYPAFQPFTIICSLSKNDLMKPEIMLFINS